MKNPPPFPHEGSRPAPAPSPPLSRRRFLQLVGGAAAAALASACDQLRSQPTPSGQDTIQLVYQDWRTDWFPPMVQEMLEKFHSAHPNIRVFYTPDPENFQDKMLTDMQAGTAPDVFQGCCTHFPTWAQLGYTLDLRSYIESDLDQDTIDDWDPAQYRALATTDGQQFGLPKYHGALALYYNRDILDAYSVEHPDDTWDHNDYLAAMKRLTHDRDGDGQTDLWGSMFDVTWDRIQMHVNGWGGHFVDPDDSTHSLMCEPEAMAAMEWLRTRMWDDGVMATPLDVQNMSTRQAFIAGRLAMVEDGSWALRDILAGADFPVGVAPFPAGPVRRVTLATTDGFGIYAGTRHPEAAWELLKFLISEEYGLAMARANFLQPARASLVNQWASYIREAFPGKIGDQDIAAFADGHVKGYSATAEVFTNMAGVKQIADAAWNQIFSLGQAPIEEMVTACRQIQEIQP